MEFISNIVYSLMPDAVTNNVWFTLGIALLYAVLSCLQSFVKDPRYGWVAKYDDPLQIVLGVLGVWKKKSYTVMANQQNTVRPAQEVFDEDPLNASKR